ncbi:hypothetical protein F0Q45_11075 [Mycobacterium simiae]|uniref:Uncharacterized protein n=1 Tax=Mycobacterium simiae TaxID=1784 RepID=A0A5B1BQV4_MYCSI|nr:hypothetical protein [Mycobacterium simiae]KAA1250175.1 hypothetical protein F0Q45_11075 [Mycobacterium simiae]
MAGAAEHGPQRFLADLAEAGISARVEGAVIIYNVSPIAGALAGVEVTTAVSVNELQSWPVTVPHWLHFPDYVVFATTNSDVSDCLTGWVRHSRDIGAFKTSIPVVHTWLAHVRGVLSDARQAA